MAYSDTEVSKRIILNMSEKEAKYLLALTQNCLLHTGADRVEDQMEPTEEQDMRQSIFEAIYDQGLRTD